MNKLKNMTNAPTDTGIKLIFDAAASIRYDIRFNKFMMEYMELLNKYCRGNHSEMSRASGLNRSTIRKYANKYGL